MTKLRNYHTKIELGFETEIFVDYAPFFLHTISNWNNIFSISEYPKECSKLFSPLSLSFFSPFSIRFVWREEREKTRISHENSISFLEHRENIFLFKNFSGSAISQWKFFFLNIYSIFAVRWRDDSRKGTNKDERNHAQRDEKQFLISHFRCREFINHEMKFMLWCKKGKMRRRSGNSLINIKWEIFSYENPIHQKWYKFFIIKCSFCILWRDQICKLKA